MIALSIILIFLIGLSCWIVTTPLRIKIDTENQLYQVHWKGIAEAILIPLSNDFLIRFRVFFWKKDFYPLRQKAKQLEKKEKTKKVKSTKQSSDLNRRFKKGIQLLKSFEVKTFKLNLDTDNYIYNSYLYPVFYFLNKEHRQLKINYQGDLELQLEIENRLYRILIALFF